MPFNLARARYGPDGAVERAKAEAEEVLAALEKLHPEVNYRPSKRQMSLVLSQNDQSGYLRLILIGHFGAIVVLCSKFVFLYFPQPVRDVGIFFPSSQLRFW